MSQPNCTIFVGGFKVFLKIRYVFGILLGMPDMFDIFMG